ncbi:unnamed protein product [Dovyalis caffra]|uniref:Carboxypeptidase n=1 Tax=Dovyalis caffra TaxID=77055 RepID=A0AAV1SBT1_9ROSI|nr:unnamed protein product [Dovyalis caffra]
MNEINLAVANVIFLESPAGVGFSYSNTSSDYVTGDKKTAEDAYTFLVNWLERFPQYKSRDFYITGESYAGHYVPQLAYTILSHNNSTNQTVINLKGIAIGNAWVDRSTGTKGSYDYYWTHALNSDETNAAINKYCDFVTGNFSSICDQYQSQADAEVGRLDSYNIYAPLCNQSTSKSGSSGSVKDFDPCSDDYVRSYLNLAQVQTALHAKPTKWEACGGQLEEWTDSPTTILPTMKQLMAIGIRVWMYSGDIDSVVSVTTSRYAINTFNLPVETAWRPWYTSNEVGGYVVGYKGVALVTVRGSGHTVPSYQPERALTMISSKWRDPNPTKLNTLEGITQGGTASVATKHSVRGYVVGYKGVALVPVRGSGHTVASYQQEQALTIVSSFLQGTFHLPLNKYGMASPT